MMSPIGIIGGSGLYQMDGVAVTDERAVDTPFGAPSDTIRLGTLDGVPVAFLPRHGRHHTIAPGEINFRANIWALKSLGVERVLSVSAVGSMKEAIVPGHLVLVDQFIDRTGPRVSTFFGGGAVVHVSFADPVCGALHQALAGCRAAVPTTMHPRGTYVCIEGPMFSSRAESQLYRSWDVDVIGMTNYQEARLAREAELCYATIALATDYDCWRAGEACDAASIVAVITQNVANAQRLLRAVVPQVSGRVRQCPCAHALQHAIMTPPDHIPPATKQRLALLLGPYVR